MGSSHFLAAEETAHSLQELMPKRLCFPLLRQKVAQARPPALQVCRGD